MPKYGRFWWIAPESRSTTFGRTFYQTFDMTFLCHAFFLLFTCRDHAHCLFSSLMDGTFKIRHVSTGIKKSFTISMIKTYSMTKSFFSWLPRQPCIKGRQEVLLNEYFRSVLSDMGSHYWKSHT